MTGISISAEADRGGFASDRDQYIGIPPEQLPALIAAATAPLEKQGAEQRDEIRRLSESLGTTEGIVRATLAALAPHLGDLAPEALPAKVADLVRERQQLHDRQRDRLDEPDPVLAALDRELERAFAAGADVRAQALLERKRDLKRAAAARRREAADHLREAEARDLRDAAESEAMLGDLARARLDYHAAASHFAEAASIVEPADPAKRLAYLEREIHALYDQGNEFGDNGALRLAVQRSRAFLSLCPREKFMSYRAAIQSSLGLALMTLGERESSNARLEEAVTVYRDALLERTGERPALFWAVIEHNLGNALLALGERESDTQRLEQAATAYGETLLKYTRKRVPLKWAGAQNNLGVALAALGEREPGTTRLEAAVAAYRDALLERTRKRVPLDWASTQNNLGNALAALGEREPGTVRLKQAVAAYHNALLERTRERVPLQWAMTKNNLGAALYTIGKRVPDTAWLEDAIATYRDALLERTRERVPLRWAATRHNLGKTLLVLFERNLAPGLLDEAEAAIADARQVDVVEAGQAHYAAYYDDLLARVAALRAQHAANR